MTRKYEINGTPEAFQALEAYLKDIKSFATYKVIPNESLEREIEKSRRAGYKFTTHDGVDIYSKDQCYLILNETNYIFGPGIYQGLALGGVYFSTKEKAEEYLNIKQNPAYITIENNKKLKLGDSYYVYYSDSIIYKNTEAPRKCIAQIIVEQSKYNSLRETGVRWFATVEELLDYRKLMQKTNKNESKIAKLSSLGSVLFKSTDNHAVYINKVRNNNTGITYTIGDTIDITCGKSEILSFEVLEDNNIKVYVKTREGGYNNSVFLKNIDNVQ